MVTIITSIFTLTTNSSAVAQEATTTLATNATADTEPLTGNITLQPPFSGQIPFVADSPEQLASVVAGLLEILPPVENVSRLRSL